MPSYTLAPERPVAPNKPIPHPSGRNYVGKHLEELHWFETNQAQLEVDYKGQWLAIDGPHLVAHGPDLPAVLKQTQAQGHVNPWIISADRDHPEDIISWVGLTN